MIIHEDLEIIEKHLYCLSDRLCDIDILSTISKKYNIKINDLLITFLSKLNILGYSLTNIVVKYPDYNLGNNIMPFLIIIPKYINIKETSKKIHKNLKVAKFLH